MRLIFDPNLTTN